MDYKVRPIRADEWPAAKELRLLALQDDAAPVAFLETYEEALARPDSFWKERTARSADGAARARQFIAEGVDRGWGGTVTVLLEEAGAVDWAGASVERRQGHLVAVFVRPELRGRGLAEALIEAAVEWAWGRGAERVRLMVHEGNPRAQGFYRKVGFVPSGVTVPLSGPEGELERELELEFVLERS